MVPSHQLRSPISRLLAVAEDLLWHVDTGLAFHLFFAGMEMEKYCTCIPL
jgi:hypothetical protein